MPYPTRRLALLLALVAPLWLLSGSTAGAIAAILATLAAAAAAALDMVRAPVRGAVEVERELPATIGLGESAEGAYRLGSNWPRALRVQLHDRLPAAVAPGPGASGGATAATDVPPPPSRDWVSLPAGGSVTVPLRLVGRARGLAELGPVAVRVGGAWGLVDRVLRPEPTGASAVTVAPSVAGIRRYRLLAIQRRLRDAGVRQLRRRGQGTSFANLRDYVVGDDPRHVDWKATARRGRTMVREYTVEQGQSVVLAVDAGRMMTQLAGDGLSRFEHALTAALVLADVAVHSGDQVGLLLFDDEVRAWLPPARGAPALVRLRSALVPARATMTEPDYAGAFRTLATRHHKRALVVLFTDVVDERSSQALVALTARGAARHLPLVVALHNDALAAAALPRPHSTPEALFTAAAAEELVLAREGALQRMRRAGVSVVDVSPTHMAAAVVNRYLELKGRAAV